MDSATWIGDISLISKNQMNVAMDDGLPRRFADVDTDVETIRRESLLQDFMTLSAEFSDLHMFFHLKVKETGHMPFGNDERVSGESGKRA